MTEASRCSPRSTSVSRAPIRFGDAPVDIAAEGLADALAHAQPFGHLIERAGEAPDLVAPGRQVDAVLEIPALHGLGARTMSGSSG